MIKSSRFATFAAILAGVFVSSSQMLDAEIQIKADVISSNSTTSTVRFTFNGDLTNFASQVNLKSFLFIGFGESPGLSTSFPATADLTQFVSNSVATASSSTINKVEVRTNEGYYYDRIGFVFDSALSSTSTLAENSVLEVEISTTAPISTSDFNNLPVYWCFPDWGTNQGRGTLVGVVNPVEESATIKLVRDAGGQHAIEFSGILESSPDLKTPFTPVIGATSPYAVPSDALSQYFFRAAVN